MTRRLILAAVALSILGGGVATATAAPAPGTAPATKQLCVVAFNDPASPYRDGLCVWVPLGAQQ